MAVCHFAVGYTGGGGDLVLVHSTISKLSVMSVAAWVAYNHYSLDSLMLLCFECWVMVCLAVTSVVAATLCVWLVLLLSNVLLLAVQSKVGAVETEYVWPQQNTQRQCTWCCGHDAAYVPRWRFA